MTEEWSSWEVIDSIKKVELIKGTLKKGTVSWGIRDTNSYESIVVIKSERGARDLFYNYKILCQGMKAKKGYNNANK